MAGRPVTGTSLVQTTVRRRGLPTSDDVQPRARASSRSTRESIQKRPTKAVSPATSTTSPLARQGREAAEADEGRGGGGLVQQPSLQLDSARSTSSRNGSPGSAVAASSARPPFAASLARPPLAASSARLAASSARPPFEASLARLASSSARPPFAASSARPPFAASLVRPPFAVSSARPPFAASSPRLASSSARPPSAAPLARPASPPRLGGGVLPSSAVETEAQAFPGGGLRADSSAVSGLAGSSSELSRGPPLAVEAVSQVDDPGPRPSGSACG